MVCGIGHRGARFAVREGGFDCAFSLLRTNPKGSGQREAQLSLCIG